MPLLVLTVLFAIILLGTKSLMQPAFDAEMARQTAQVLKAHPEITADKMAGTAGDGCEARADLHHRASSRSWSCSPGSCSGSWERSSSRGRRRSRASWSRRTRSSQDSGSRRGRGDRAPVEPRTHERHGDDSRWGSARFSIPTTPRPRSWRCSRASMSSRSGRRSCSRSGFRSPGRCRRRTRTSRPRSCGSSARSPECSARCAAEQGAVSYLSSSFAIVWSCMLDVPS